MNYGRPPDIHVYNHGDTVGSFLPLTNEIYLGSRTAARAPEYFWTRTLCHELHHWAQFLFVSDVDIVGNSKEWLKVNQRKGAYPILERAAVWGLRPSKVKLITIEEVSKNPRPPYFRRVEKKGFWSFLKCPPL
jgi:hypothetical protein